MSARHNKKRKGRSTITPRERTVTTLTEDPNTAFLVPTPSEEPAGQNLMSSPFSVASSSGGPNGQGAFGSFNFSFTNYMAQSQQQFYPQSILPPGQNDLEVLEKLKEMIKNGQHECYRPVPQPAALASIYLGPANVSHVPPHPEQAPSDYRPIGYPQPSSNTTGNDSLSRPILRSQSKDTWEASGKAPSSAVSEPQTTHNSDTMQVDSNSNRYNENNKTDNTPRSPIKQPSISDSKPLSSAPTQPDLSSSQRPSRFDTITSNGSTGTANNSAHDLRSPTLRKSDPVRTVGSLTGESPYDSRPSSTKYDGSKDDLSRGAVREPPWLADDRRSRPDSTDPPRASLRGPSPGRYDRDRDRLRDRDVRDRDVRERDRDRDVRDRDIRDTRDRDWDRERDRRIDYRRYPRPPPEQRHWEPRYPGDSLRKHDAKSVSGDDSLSAVNGSKRTEPPSPSAPRRRSIDERRPPGDERRPLGDDRRPALDDRRPAIDERRSATLDDRKSILADHRPATDERRPAVDERLSRPPIDDRGHPPPTRVPPPDVRPRASTLDERTIKPPLPEDRRVPAPIDRTSRPPAAVVPEATAIRDDHIPRTPIEERKDRSQIPLEERISRPATLQDRISQPPTSSAPRVADTRVSRQPSLEERLSHAPAAASNERGRSAPDDRSVRPIPTAPDRTSVRPDDRSRPPLAEPARLPATTGDRLPPHADDRGRPGERYVRPPTPAQDRERATTTFKPPSRSASIVREEARPIKAPPSPPPQLHDHRAAPGRAPSRERERSGYRGEYGYSDDRRTDTMDVDVPPPRANDSRPPYRRFSPPLPSDIARDRERVRSFYPPAPTPAPAPASPPLPAREPVYENESDRRYPPEDRRDWQFNSSTGSRRPRDWPPQDDEYWKNRRSTWDRPSLERDRPEREAPPATRSSGWEMRDDRDRRSTFPEPASAPPPPAARSFESSQRPLSSRITDGYSGSGEERSYPPRERYPPLGTAEKSPPPVSRVRPRSPSPVGRRHGPGTALEDLRPPLKRSRDDPSYSGYYSPQRRSADYPPTSSGSGGYYESRGGQGAFSSGSASGPPSHDRDYVPPRERASDIGSYTTSSYDRAPPPRSPPPSRAPPSGYRGGAYTRDSRDDRRYDMPPPPRSG